MPDVVLFNPLRVVTIFSMDADAFYITKKYYVDS